MQVERAELEIYELTGDKPTIDIIKQIKIVYFCNKKKTESRAEGKKEWLQQI